MDWWTMRLVTSKHLQCTLRDVRQLWSFAEILEAHMTLDALEGVRDALRPDPPRRRPKG